MSIKFEANYEVQPIVIKCDNNYTEKYTKATLRKRLEEVFGHNNFVVWIDRTQPDCNRKYTYEVTKMFDPNGYGLIPIFKSALNPGENLFQTVRDTQKRLDRKNHDEFERYLDKYEDSPDDQKVIILMEAISYMQAYNGRSIHECIVLAMGGTIDTINDHDSRIG